MISKEQNQTAAAKAMSPEQKQDAPQQAKNGHEKSAMLKTEIKKVWSKLTEDDINLHEKQPDLFFGRVKDKHGIERAEAEKRLESIKEDCGCGTSCNSNDKKAD